jgi:hypothetical protein
MAHSKAPRRTQMNVQSDKKKRGSGVYNKRSKERKTIATEGAMSE